MTSAALLLICMPLSTKGQETQVMRLNSPSYDTEAAKLRAMPSRPYEFSKAMLGDVIFEGRSFVGRPPYSISQAGVAIVPQGRRIFKSLTVRENLALPTSALTGRKHAQLPGRKRWDLQEVLKEFPQLAERLNNAGGSLSGGEQQMLAIGRALMANPSLILMDEPSEGLSPILVHRVEEIMRSLRAHGHSILLVEQNLALAMSVADSIYVISSGRFVFHGTPNELSASAEILDGHLGVSSTQMH